MTNAFQRDSFQNDTYQTDAITEFAFQQCAFDSDGFQAETCVSTGFAFQQCAFESDAFQADDCPIVIQEQENTYPSYISVYFPEDKKRTKRDIQEARKKYGLAFDVVEKVAKRQVEDLHLDDLQKTEELIRELELRSIEYDSKYLELLNDYRDELMNFEISRLLKEKMLVEEQELLLLLAAALSIN